MGQHVSRTVAGTEMTAEQEIEALREALRWALVALDDDEVRFAGERADDYSGATRIAWPDEPENWA